MPLFKYLAAKKKKKPSLMYIPSFLRKTRTNTQVSDSRTSTANTDLTTLRLGSTDEQIVRDYAKSSPDVSHALESIMRFTITDAYTVVAKDLETDTINPDVTKMVQTLASRLDKLPSNFDGFSYQSSIASTSESLVLQLLINGCCATELVLDKTLLPEKFQPISTNYLKYKDNNDRLVPYVDDGTGPIYLDSPLVNIISLSQDPDTPYSLSWFKSAIQAVIASSEFVGDLRRSFRKASLPRVTAEIDTDKFKASLPPEVQYDQKKLKAAMDSLIANIEDKLQDLNPEDALVNYDLVKIDHLSAGNISSHESVNTHATIVNGQMSAGLHVLPSLLGRGESQTTASTEAVLFLKIVESLQSRLNEVYSYLFTMAARLHGHDVTVAFKYKKPSLRPEIEEESFQSMRQSRILEQLSLGLISDEEASIKLTGDLPSGNYTPLSGSMFHKNTGTTENPYSNTSVSGNQLNNTKEQKDRSQGDTQPKTNQTTG